MPAYLHALDQHLRFPAVGKALTDPDGLLAVGGDLSVPRLRLAYESGIFPWFSGSEPILWWSPSVRAIFAPDTLQLNRTLRKLLHKHQLTFSVNCRFQEVVQHCATLPRRGQSGTWILPQMQQAYLQLHHAGIAHSIEVWRQQQLVGGLYGITVGQLFCGESMFNLEPNTAKFALIMLQQHLSQYSAGWIDCQLPNPFLMQLGAQKINREDYILLLEQLKIRTVPANVWQPKMLTLN